MTADTEEPATDEPDRGSPSDPKSTMARRPGRRRRIVRRLGIPAVAVGVGLGLGWLLFDDDGQPVAGTSTQQVRIDVDPRTFKKFGIAFGRPKGWSAAVRRGVLNASSPDSSMSVAISIAGASGKEQQVRASDRKELKRLFKAKEVGRRRSSVGTAPTLITELTGTQSKGRRIRILSMGLSSRWQTYSVQVFTVPQPSSRRVLELRALLSSVRYSKPS